MLGFGRGVNRDGKVTWNADDNGQRLQHLGATVPTLRATTGLDIAVPPEKKKENMLPGLYERKDIREHTHTLCTWERFQLLKKLLGTIEIPAMARVCHANRQGVEDVGGRCTSEPGGCTDLAKTGHPGGSMLGCGWPRRACEGGWTAPFEIFFQKKSFETSLAGEDRALNSLIIPCLR
jgi:hypothetical protein